MPEEPTGNTPTTGPSSPIKVFTIRDWKEYVGESLLIIFSVLLALLLTSSRISFPLMSRLSDLYENQARILKLEDKVGSVILDRESRNPANAAVTLALIRDNYRGWAFDRAPGLLVQYDEAIKAIDETKE